MTYASSSADGSDGQFPVPGEDDGEDSVSVLAIGARRFPPPPNCYKCGKPGVDGSDYLACCGIWLAVQMFCNLCHCPTRKQQFDKSGCRGRWYFPMCGTDDDTGASPGVGHEVPTPDEMVLVLRHHRRTAALRERQSSERSAPPLCSGRVNVVMLLPPAPDPPASAAPPSSAVPPAAPVGMPAAPPAASTPAARTGQPATTSAAKSQPRPTREASSRQRRRAQGPTAAESVAERRLIVYEPQQRSGRQPQASPPMQLLWTVVPGDQVPLLSKGEFEAAVKRSGGRLLGKFTSAPATNRTSTTDLKLFFAAV